jgi:hypothetical protein
MANRQPTGNKVKIHTNYFSGGVTISKKLGIANSFYYSQGLDFRSDPAQISVLPGARTVATNLTDLITAVEQDLNGVRWGVGSNGGIYKINTSDVVSKEAQLATNGAAGILYNQVTDQLYIPDQTTVSMYGQVTTGITGNPKFRKSQFAQSASTSNGCVNLFNSSDGFFDGLARNNAQSIGVGITNVSQVTTNTTATYSVPIALSEAVGNFCYFAPDIEPFYSIPVYIVAKGTGDWTLTLHDSLNNKLAAVTVTNVNLTNNAYNEFKFTSPVRALVSASQTGTSATYHWHITSTVANGTVGTLTANDLSTADFLLFAYRLVQTQNGWHPTALFTGSGVPQLCIGNGNYLSTYNFGNDTNPTNFQWVRHQLFFKPGYEVCGLSTNNQYLVIAVERRSSNSNRNFQDGALYFWDGTTNAPNMVIDIPMGSPYGLYTFNNVTYFACAGSLFAWSGGQTVIKVRKLAYQSTDYLNTVDNTIVNPNMFTSRYNLLEMGYPSSTTNVNINYGVWTWGTVELTFPNSYGLSYTLANGYLNNTSPISGLQIGCVQNFVDTMYISWQYTDANSQVHYGLDVVDNTSVSAPAFSWQSLIWDGGVSYKIKFGARIKITCLPVPTGTALQVGYSLDRGAWVWGNSAAVGDVGVTIDVNQRFHEIQYGFKGTTTGTLTPWTGIGVTFDVDTLPRDEQMTKSQ